jgi:hypothetical protein
MAMNPPPRSYGLRVLKASVIGMAVLIAIATAILIYGLATRSGTAPGAALLDPGKALVLRLGLPQQTQVRSMVATERTLSLHLDIPEQGQWIYVIPLSGSDRMLRIAVSGGDVPR